MLTKKLNYVLGLSYLYGAQRQWNSDFKKPNDLFVERCYLSLINGVLYVCPPFSIVKFLCLCDRIEIKYKGKNPDDYKSSYQEFFTHNYNML